MDPNISDVLRRLNSDLAFLVNRGVVHPQWQHDVSKYLNKVLKEQSSRGSCHPPLRADQPPLRPAPASLIDIECLMDVIDGSMDSRHEGHGRRQSSAHTITGVAGGTSRPSTGVERAFPMTGYDLDQHESDGAAEWLKGADSPSDTPSARQVRDNFGGTNGISSPPVTTDGFAIKGAAGKATNSKRRRDRGHRRRGRGRGQSLNDDHQAPENWTKAGPHSTNKDAGGGSQNIVCPFWFTYNDCRQTACGLTHAFIPGRPREKLECAYWRTVTGCVRDDCEFEHHATAHGLVAGSRGRGGRGGR